MNWDNQLAVYCLLLSDDESYSSKLNFVSAQTYCCNILLPYNIIISSHLAHYCPFYLLHVLHVLHVQYYNTVSTQSVVVVWEILCSMCMNHEKTFLQWEAWNNNIVYLSPQRKFLSKMLLNNECWSEQVKCICLGGSALKELIFGNTHVSVYNNRKIKFRGIGKLVKFL